MTEAVALRVPNRDLAGLWVVNSQREAWHPRMVALWKDGQGLCSCERGTRGCRHIEAAKESQAAEEHALDERAEEIREEFAEWQGHARA
jgi:hypothetical protein